MVPVVPAAGRQGLLGVEALHGMPVLLLLLLLLHLLLPLLHYLVQRGPLVVVEGHLVLWRRRRNLLLRVVRGGVGVLVPQPGVRPHHGLHHAPLVHVRRQRRHHHGGQTGRRRRGRRVLRRGGSPGEDRLRHLVLQLVPLLDRSLVHPLSDVHREERPRRSAQSTAVAAVVHGKRSRRRVILLLLQLLMMKLLRWDYHRRRPRTRARGDERLVLAGVSLR